MGYIRNVKLDYCLIYAHAHHIEMFVAPAIHTQRTVKERTEQRSTFHGATKHLDMMSVAYIKQ